MPLRDVKGKELIEESLRERCLYQTLANENINQNYTQWFNYVLKFQDDCTADSK